MTFINFNARACFFENLHTTDPKLWPAKMKELLIRNVNSIGIKAPGELPCLTFGQNANFFNGYNGVMLAIS